MGGESQVSDFDLLVVPRDRLSLDTYDYQNLPEPMIARELADDIVPCSRTDFVRDSEPSRGGGGG
jgi:hypothetical protein